MSRSGILRRLIRPAGAAGLRTFEIRPRTAVWMVALVAFTVRLLHVLSYETFPTNDMAVFVDMAINRLTAANLFSAEGLAGRPPGYPFFLKPFFLAFDFMAAVKAVQIAQALLGAWLCVLVYRITRRIHSRRAGLLAALLTCFYPHFLFYSSILMSETLFIPAYYATLLLFLRAMERPRAWAFLRAGLVAAAVVLIRPAAVSLAPATLAAAWTASSTHKGRVRALALVMAGGLLVIGPWSLRNLAAYGHFSLIAPNGAMTLAAANNPESTGGHTSAPMVGKSDVWEREQLYMNVVKEYVTERPVDALYLGSARKWHYFWLLLAPWPLHAINPQLFVGEHFFPWVSWFTVLLLGSIGLGALVEQRRRWAWLTPACFLSYTAFYMIFYGSPRFRLPAEGYFLVWAGAGLVSVARLFPRIAAARTGTWAATVGVFLVLVLGQSGLSAVAARSYLRSPGSLVAAGPTIEVDHSRPSIPLLGEDPAPLDRTRARFIRLSFHTFREGPERVTPDNGTIKITFLDKEGRSLQYGDNITYNLMAVPPGRWTRVILKAPIPTRARACRVTLHPRRSSPDTFMIGQPTLRLARGNTLFLESVYPYFKYEE